MTTLQNESLPVPARHLRVRVTEAGQTRADLTLPVAAAEHLPDLIPADLTEKLQDRGLDVAAIAAGAAARGFPPGNLFGLTEGSKQVRVWLE